MLLLYSSSFRGSDQVKKIFLQVERVIMYFYTFCSLGELLLCCTLLQKVHLICFQSTYSWEISKNLIICSTKKYVFRLDALTNSQILC